jgi:predicted DsbA family dithiol-disulfide isomerase
VARLTIDIVSDTICPWCFVGKRRLEAALAQRPLLEVERHWRPFRLDPGIPPEGADHRKRLEEKFGSGARIDAAWARLRTLGEGVGIAFAFDRIGRTPDTIPGHCVVRWARAQGGAALEDAMVERMFRAYFEEGQDLTGAEVLARLAGEVGLDGARVAEDLASGRDLAEVRAEADGWLRSGIDGVPTFIFNGKYLMSGAQEVGTFLQVIDKVVAGRAG